MRTMLALCLLGGAAIRVPAQNPFDEGRRFFNLGQFSDAATWFEKAVKQRDDTVSTHLWLARAYVRQIPTAGFLSQPGLALRAKSQFDRAVELEPKNVEVREDRAIFYMYSPAIIGGGIGKARAEAEVARKLDAYRGGMLSVQIETHEKNNAVVEQECLTLVRNYPDSAGPFNLLVAAYQTSNRFPEAFAVIDARLSVRPKDAAALFQMGKTAALSGQKLGQGEAALRAYIGMPRAPGLTSDAWAHYRIGMIREMQRDAKGARAEYEAALELDPHLTDADRALKRLSGG